MKVLLYTENLKTISKSGLGKAINHQKKALELNNIEYTTNKNDDYDILHLNFFGPNSYLLAKKAKKQGKKVVYHAHSTEEDFRNSFLFSNVAAPLFKKWLIKCYTLGDYIVTPTPYSKMLLENYGIKKPIRAISNGIDLSKFKTDKKLGNEFRKMYNIKKNEKVIIGIGLYIKRKGIIDFVELAKMMPEYKFIWFGYSPLSAVANDVKKAVKTKLDNLTFAGYVDSSVIAGAMNGADLYVFPTLEETEGIPIIEACACQIDAIVRDIPVFEGWLFDNINIYKAKDVFEFEKKIKLILNKKLPSITQDGFKVAQQRDLKIIGTQLKEVYEIVSKM
ncbi:MAG: glycosyltransferase [Mycoplasmatota bacterium]